MEIGTYVVPSGVRRENQWGCRAQLIARTENEFTFRRYDGEEFRLRRGEFERTNWEVYIDIPNFMI
jgi:hypothetical protein